MLEVFFLTALETHIELKTANIAYEIYHPWDVNWCHNITRTQTLALCEWQWQLITLSYITLKRDSKNTQRGNTISFLKVILEEILINDFLAMRWDYLIPLAAWTILWISFNILAKFLPRNFVVKKVKWLCNYLLNYQHFYLLNKVSTKSSWPTLVNTALKKSDFSHNIIFLLFPFLVLYFFEYFKYLLSLHSLFSGVDFYLLHLIAPHFKALFMSLKLL